ncbi:MAG: TonB family protein [Limibacillus sp.]
MIRAKAKELRKGEGVARRLDASRVVPLFPRVQPRPLIVPPSGPATRQSRGLSRPLLLTALLSLAAHGGALAAFFGWTEGPRIEAGAPFVVEVVAFSAAGGGDASPAEAAASNAVALAAPQPPQRSQAPARPQQPQDAELPAPQPRPLPITAPSQQVATPPVAAVAEPVPAPVSAPVPAPDPEPAREPAAKAGGQAMAESPEPVEAPAATPSQSTPQSTSQAAPPAAVSPPPVKPSIPQQAALPPASASQETHAGAPSGSASSSPGDGAGSSTGASRAASPAAGNAPPDYPLIARRRGQEGLVVVLVTLSPAGLPEQIALAEASGVASLDAAALEAVRGWRFTPATENGRAVASELRVPIRFRLEQ